MAKRLSCLLHIKNFPQHKDKHSFGVRAERKSHFKQKGLAKKAGVMVLIFDHIVFKLNLVIIVKFILIKETIH